MFSFLKKLFIILFLLHNCASFASGGYDKGTPAGKGNIDIDITINPFLRFGQSYVVWGYGLTNRLDFHGYASHPASGVDQIYCGFMYNFMSNKYIDLSTAFGLRFRQGITNSFFPQLLYTIKLPKGFDIIGSIVLVYYESKEFNGVTSFKNVRDNKGGVTYDVALRIPLPFKKTPSFVKEVKLAIGAFRGVSHHVYPTYSVDFRFDLSKPNLAKPEPKRNSS